MSYTEKTVSASDGLKLYVRDYRATDDALPPIVCLAGLTRNSRDFDVLAEEIQQRGHRVVTMDYRGRGKSEYDLEPKNYHPATYVSDIFQVTTALGLHGCVFIGTSLGGLLSMGLATMIPTLVRAAVLNDVGPDLVKEALGAIIAYTSDGAGANDLDGVVQKLKTYYSAEGKQDFQTIAERTYRLLDGKYIPDWDVKIAENLKAGENAEAEQDLWPYFLALCERPVLLLRGENSTLFRDDTYQKMLQSLPNIKGVVVAQAGHAPTLEEPESKQAILDFLKSL